MGALAQTVERKLKWLQDPLNHFLSRQHLRRLTCLDEELATAANKGEDEAGGNLAPSAQLGRGYGGGSDRISLGVVVFRVHLPPKRRTIDESCLAVLRNSPI